MFDNLTAEQKNRMTVHKDVRSICQETTHCVGLEIQVHAMELIAELVWKKMQVMGADLECFAKHAKRSTINADDVKLLVRRNPSLKAHISKLNEENATAAIPKEGKRKKSSLPGTSSSSTVAAAITANPQPSTSSTKTSNIPAVQSSEDDSPFIRMLNSKLLKNIAEKEVELDDTIDLT